MGHKQSPALIVIVAALLLLTPLAYAQLLPNSSGIFTGILCCTPTGTCANGSPRLPGVAVNLRCRSLLTGAQTLVQGLTNSVGGFIVSVTNSLVTNPLGVTCNVFVNLPLNSTVCPILSTVDGVLTGVPTLVIPILNAVLGPIFVFVFQLLSLV